MIWGRGTWAMTAWTTASWEAARTAAQRLWSGGWAPRVATVVLAAASLADVAGAYHQFRSRLSDAGSPAVTLPLRASRPPDLQGIIATHLFGQAQQNPTQLPASTAHFLLSGTLAAANPSAGFAILSGPSKGTRLYAAGAQLDGRIRLYQVYQDRVILERNGELEDLVLPKVTSSAIVLAAEHPNSEVAWADTEAASAPAASDPRDFSRTRSWFNGFSPQGEFEDDRFVGFRLQPIKRYEREYDIRSGDIVKAINGVPIDSPETAQQILQRASGTTVAMTIERDGVSQQRSLNVDGL